MNRTQEKLLRASKVREKLIEKKAMKFKEMVKKAEERKELKEEQERTEKEQLMLSIETKLLRAEELKKQQLKKIIAKAHDEEYKVSEIMFINSIEAENKRHDILIKEKDFDKRLQDIQEERQRKVEEKAAKEAAVEERRKALEAERQERVERIKQKIEEKDKKIEQQMQEKEKERLELALQKAKERELKLWAKEAAHQANVEELQKKILLKQEKSKRRHEENIEQIRSKAFESSVRKVSSQNSDDKYTSSSIPYQVKKMCTLCKVIIGSEVYLYSHLRSKRHQFAIRELHNGQVPSKKQLECYNLKYIVDVSSSQSLSGSNDSSLERAKVDKNIVKSLNKKRKKTKQRLLFHGQNFEANWLNAVSQQAYNSNNRLKIIKIIKEIKNLIENVSQKDQLSSNLTLTFDRQINELMRLIGHKADEKIVFNQCDGLNILISLLTRSMDTNKDTASFLLEKSCVNMCTLLQLTCTNHYDNCKYLFFSTKISTLLDILAHRSNILINETGSSPICSTWKPFDAFVASVARLLSIVINTICDSLDLFNNDQENSLNQRINDMISYTINIGIIDKLSLCISNSQGLVTSDPELARLLRQSLSFITSLTKLLACVRNIEDLFTKDEPKDATEFIVTLRMTHIVGVVPLVYGTLFDTGSTVRSQSPSSESPQHILDIALESFQLLNYFALFDLNMLQVILGSESLSLQLRHIASYLISYCTHWKADPLLHEVILLLGYFTINNFKNQGIIQSGQRPTVLQQLCSLPFEYFSDPSLCKVLLPTLITCCFENQENKSIIEQEMSTSILASFIESTIIDLQLKAVDDKNGHTRRLTDERWSLFARFPKSLWLDAKKYFK